MRRNHGIIGIRQQTNDTAYGSTTSGVFDMFDQYTYNKDLKWPTTKLITSVTPSSTSVTEGVGFTIVVSGTGYNNNTTLYYKWTTVSGTAIDSNDIIVGNLNGSFNFSQSYPTNNTITFNYTFRAEYPADSESNVLKFGVYEDSACTQLLKESSNITIVDATGTVVNQWAVSNPSVQWIWEADGFLTGSTGTISANTATQNQDRWGFYNNATYNSVNKALPEASWIADKDIVKTSYTTNSGETRYYLTFPNDLDFCPNSNTSDGSAIRRNGGFTFFYVKQPYSYGSTGQMWGRYLLYSGLCEKSAAFTGGRNPSTSYQYSEPGYFEYHYPSGNESHIMYAPRGADTSGSNNAPYAYRNWESWNTTNIEYACIVYNFGTASSGDFINSTMHVTMILENAITGASVSSLSNSAFSISSNSLGQDVDTNNVAVTYAVTVAASGGANRFVLDGVSYPPINLIRESTYTFDQTDSTNDGHPLVFKNGSSAYQTGVTYYLNGSAASYSDYTNVTTFNAGRSSGDRKVVIEIDVDAPTTGLIYYCFIHGNGMGNTITLTDGTKNTARPFFHDSIYWSNGANDHRWIMAGWANRPYTSSEQTALVNELKNLYGQ